MKAEEDSDSEENAGTEGNPLLKMMKKEKSLVPEKKKLETADALVLLGINKR